MGDAVYELHVRAQLLSEDLPVEKLHTAKVARVRASAQAAALRRIMPQLQEEEADMVRRGRNLKCNIPKNVSVSDYRHSTAFEALLGMLYLQGASDRLHELLNATEQPGHEVEIEPNE